ncbi:MAG: DUF835 domain-containing protein [Thermoplasmata archaeon]|nr:DUF835 domain-containing protein [Thermoplasmata archaeon]
MGYARPVALAAVLFLLLLWTAVLPSGGQGSTGHLVVATDYELFGTSDLRGGGHVTWTWSGDKAVDLRTRLVSMFDTYAAIPRGFAFGSAGTSANQDGILDSTEGVRYTDLLENWLEASGRGTQAQYLQLYPFDLRDKQVPASVGFDRSTTGLAGTRANTTGDAEIRFLFEANITGTNLGFPLATRALADAPYQVFSYDAVQSPALNATGLYPGSWPFLPEGGWHRVVHLGRPAFWAGNDSTGLYDNNLDASSTTSMDPALAPLNPALYVPFDLRFASRAWISFNYTGSVADASDHLRLEFAHPPAYTDWTALSFGTGVDLPGTPAGQWSNATANLTQQLGQRMRLRLHFVSNGAGTGLGFYVRDVAVHAPSTYDGIVVESDTHYLVGTLSFADPAIASGSFQLIRTPGGEILTYGSTWTGPGIPSDAMRFRTFDVTENPQVLFGIMLVACYAISRLQDSAYQRYRESHPTVYRPAAQKAKWLHWIGRAAIGFLILFYFVPAATWFVGLRIVIGGPVYWFLALTLTLLLGFGTRAYYAQKFEEAPPPAVVGEESPVVQKVLVPLAPGEPAAVAHCTHCLREILDGEKAYTCTCGAVYHLSCASGLMRCPNCRKPISVEATRTQTLVSMRCGSCGELQTVPEGSDPRTLTCASCGGRLRHLDEGKRYLILASNPALAFAWIRDLTIGGKPALCITPASPDRLKLEFGAKEVSFVQVSSNAPGAIDPKKLDPAGLKAILPLAREGKGGVIFYDGLDQIIAEGSLGDVIRFLRKANDMAFVHGATVIARVAPGRLTEPDVKKLNAEFDEYMDLSAQF